MRAKIRQILSDLRGSYWFLPAVLTLSATILSLVTWWIDIHYELTWLNNLDYFSQAKPEGARSILSTIAGSMISVAGTVFAVTFAAVVYASGSYGPRLLTNFMTDRGNQLSLGVFIATYVFALLTLRTIRLPSETGASVSTPGFVPELSMLTALGLALLSVAVLVYFLHHVPNSIRINNVVAGIGETALRQVRERYPHRWAGDVIEMGEAEVGEPVTARATGYLEVIDYETLGRVTREGDRSLRLAVRTGDFVHPGMALAYLEGGVTEEVADRVLSAFATGSSRTADQDIEFSVDELVEIALRCAVARDQRIPSRPSPASIGSPPRWPAWAPATWPATPTGGSTGRSGCIAWPTSSRISSSDRPSRSARGWHRTTSPPSSMCRRWRPPPRPAPRPSGGMRCSGRRTT